MSNLNIDILAQSVDNLSRQYEKNLTENENDQLSLQRAGALLEGLKGMFGIEDIALKPVDNTICITTTFDECVLDLFLDAQNDLKLTSVKAIKKGQEVDVSDIVLKCTALAQPNDIRQALFLMRERVSTPH